MRKSCLFLLFIQSIGSALFFPLSAAVLNKNVAKEIHSLRKVVDEALERSDFTIAKDALTQILSTADRRFLGENDYFFLHLQLAQVETYLGNLLEAKHLLRLRLAEHPPPNLLVTMTVLFSRILTKENKWEECYATLRQLSIKVPFENWAMEERSFLSAVEVSLNQQYGDMLMGAERLVETALYEEAVLLYRKVWTAIERELYPAIFKESFGPKLKQKVRFRLSEALYNSSLFSEAIALLEQDELMQGFIDEGNRENYARVLCLLAKSHRKINQNQQAIEYLSRYLRLEKNEMLPHYLPVLFELGVNYFALDLYEKGLPYFEKLTTQQKDPHLANLAYLHQAHYFLDQGKYKSVSNLLSPLKEKMFADEDLRYDWAYYQGESAFQLSNYRSAIEFFQQALPARNQKRAAWYEQVLYNLGWSYLKLAEKETTPLEEKKQFLANAVSTFEQITKEVPHYEFAYLALSRSYILKRDLLGSNEMAGKVEALLSVPDRFSSMETRAEALFLRAEAALSTIIKQALYEELTGEEYQESAFFAESWFNKGLNELELFRDQFEESFDQQKERLEAQAIASFQRAYALFGEANMNKKVLCLFYQAQIHAEKQGKEHQKKAMDIVNEIYEKHRDVLPLLEERYHIFYLQGIVASRLAEGAQEEHYARITEESFKKVIAHSPREEFIQTSLFGLGRAYFQQKKYRLAEKTFISLSQVDESPISTSEALFWASEAIKKQGKSQQEVRPLLERVFKEYPDSPHAAEAYFTYYSFEDYLLGQEEAMQHLYAIEKHYPDSPFLVLAYYLIGLDYKRDREVLEGEVRKRDFELALDSFDRVKLFFDYAYQNNKISTDHLFQFITVYYRSFLESARLKLDEAGEIEGPRKRVYLEAAMNILEKVVADFKRTEHPLTRELFLKTSYPKVYEESEYELGLVYSTMGELAAAEKLFSAMIGRYTTNNIQHGYFLAKVWAQQGKIALEQHSYTVAHDCFQKAQITAEGENRYLLSTEEKLHLWLQQSECLRMLQQYDQSMAMLSRIINDEESGAFDIRIRAMYLRAQIYELQGRRDLAKRQLEAAKRQGGFWAEKANMRLVAEYQFHDDNNRKVG